MLPEPSKAFGLPTSASSETNNGALASYKNPL
jgi:hypothetical protein